MPNMANILGGLGLGGPRPAGAGGNQQQPNLQNIFASVNNIMRDFDQAMDQPQPEASASTTQNQNQEPSGQSEGNAIQLPHQVVLRIG